MNLINKKILWNYCNKIKQYLTNSRILFKLIKKVQLTIKSQLYFLLYVRQACRLANR